MFNCPKYSIITFMVGGLLHLRRVSIIPFMVEFYYIYGGVDYYIYWWLNFITFTVGPIITSTVDCYYIYGFITITVDFYYIYGGY